MYDLDAIREQRATERAQAQAVPVDIANCPLCNDDGYRPNFTVCDHIDHETNPHTAPALQPGKHRTPHPHLRPHVHPDLHLHLRSGLHLHCGQYPPPSQARTPVHWHMHSSTPEQPPRAATRSNTSWLHMQPAPPSPASPQTQASTTRPSGRYSPRPTNTGSWPMGDLCSLCAGGVHNHTRYGPNAPEVKAGRVPLGAMAECPSVVAKGGPGCSCTYREPRSTQKHCATCRCGVTNA